MEFSFKFKRTAFILYRFFFYVTKQYKVSNLKNRCNASVLDNMIVFKPQTFEYSVNLDENNAETNLRMEEL